MNEVAASFKKKLRFIRTFEAWLSNAPLAIIQVFYLFTSKYILKSYFLNNLGIQKFRIKAADSSIHRRRKAGLSNLTFKNSDVDKFLKKLDKDGIVEVQNVLPPQIFNKLTKISSDIRDDKIEYKHFVKAGAEYREVVVKNLDPALYSYLSKEFWLKDAAKSYLAKNNIKQEWRIKLIRDYDGTFDNNTLWHADTFFNTLKAFIYLNDVDEKKDVYNYMVGSHCMTPEILDLHHKYACSSNRQPWPSQQEIDDLNLQKFHKSIKANTLVLSDTRGLHRRRPKDQTDDNWRATLFCSFRSTPFKA